jgi:uncharacterized protein
MTSFAGPGGLPPRGIRLRTANPVAICHAGGGMKQREWEMDNQDRRAIEQLFDKLGAVERRAPRRDPEAEALIRDLIATQPGAPYYMAQTIIAQEQALTAAQRRIEEAEADRQEPGGFLAGIFGGGRDRVPPRDETRREVPPAAPTARPWDRPAGGGFLAGAAQTAMGVAGGVVLGNLLAGALFGHGSAAAADDGPANAASESTLADDGADSGAHGGADADFGDGDFDSGGDFDAGGFDV